MITIKDEVLKQADISATELLQEIAVLLYQRNKLSFGQAQKLAEMNHYEFQCLLNEKGVPLHYSTEDLQDDIETLRKRVIV